MDHMILIDELANVFQEKFHLDGRTVNGVVSDYKLRLLNKSVLTVTVSPLSPLQAGSCQKVQLDGGLYEVKRCGKEPNRVSCDCPSWKYQKLNPLVRTCKHCKHVCGSESEISRVAANKEILLVLNKTMGKNYRIE